MNKRVSRLAANIPLTRRNLCPLSFIDVPHQANVDAMLGVYELNDVALLRNVFVWAYEQQYVAAQQQLVPLTPSACATATSWPKPSPPSRAAGSTPRKPPSAP